MRSKGFTLVEILVVVVIMAVVISLAVLSIGVTGRDSQLDEESRRIEGLVDLLHERALLEGRDFGLRIEPTAYEFVVYEPTRDRWLTLNEEQEFRHRELAQGRELSTGTRFAGRRAQTHRARSSDSDAAAAHAAGGDRRERRGNAVSPDAAARCDAGEGIGRRRCVRQDDAREFEPAGKAHVSRQRRRGFTLVEVLVALMVVAIGLGCADDRGERHGSHQRLFARQDARAMDRSQSPHRGAPDGEQTRPEAPTPASSSSPIAPGTTTPATSIPASRA